MLFGQAEDAFGQVRMKELDVLSPPLSKRSPQAFLFREKSGLIFRHSTYGPNTQETIPEALKQHLWPHEHRSVLAGHTGSRRLYETLRRYFFWNMMGVDINTRVAQCPGCAKSHFTERKHAFMMKLLSALEAFSRLEMDLLIPLTTSRGGHKQLLMRDRITMRTCSVPLRDEKAFTVVSAFIDT